MKAIGIDIGTTSICGVVIDAESGKVLKSKTLSGNAFIKGCAEWEKIQSVDKIITTAFSILDELITDDTAVIGVTGQMHGIVYIDKDGNAVSPLYTWQDGRGNLPYRDSTYAEFLGSCSGYGNVTDFYNRENGIRPPEAVTYSTIHDYFVMKLCSLRAPVIHDSDAASFGLYDIESGKFSYDIDIKVVHDFYIAGKYKNIPVSAAIGDNQASVFSTLANNENILINVGTGSQISIISDNIVSAENVETRPYFDGKYLTVGAALCGGRAYSLLKDFFSHVLSYVNDLNEGEIYGIMDKMLEKLDSHSLKVDTRFAGTRSDKSVTGSVTGITTENFLPEELIYGVLCGMIDELQALYNKMGADKHGIVGSGNGIRKNQALITIAEERFNSKMLIPAHLEEAAAGAALYGLVSAGALGINEVNKLIKYS